MTDIVVNYDQTKGNFQIYESTTKTLFITQTLGEGFSGLNNFLLSSGLITKSILEDQDVKYHFDSYTFQEIIKSNMSLLKRVSDIPSEFKNSAQKFGTSTGVPKDKQNFSRGSRNFQKGRMGGFGSSSFKKSFIKFGNNAKKS